MEEIEVQRIREVLKQSANVQIDAYTSGWRTLEISCPNGLSLKEYADMLEREPDELRKLVRRLLVSTTGFFRDREHWEELLEVVLYRRREPFPIDVLSIGCARGQEPYTLLMTALERGEPRLGRIIAADISRTNLEVARKGLYGMPELREVPETCLERWFTRTPVGWQIAETLRNRVQFIHYNILNEPPAGWNGGFGLVMMRNVIIHMKLEYQQIALVNAVRMLAPEGILFLGASEILPKPENYGVHRIGHCLYSRGQNQDEKGDLRDLRDLPFTRV